MQQADFVFRCSPFRWGPLIRLINRIPARTLCLSALLLSAVADRASAIDVTGKLTVTDPAQLGSGDTIFMDGGSLKFAISPTLEKSILFFGGKPSTVTAAPGQIVQFGPSFTATPTYIGIEAYSTAIFGSETDTGTVVIDTDVGSSHPTGRVVVAGGTLKGGIGLSMLLASAASTTVREGATLDFSSGIGYVHNLRGSGRVITGTGGDLALLVDDGSSSEFSGVISGAGRVSVMNFGFTNGTMILSGDNTYTGGTFICVCSTLQLGNGGTSGSIRGDVINGGTLAFNRSDIYVFTGAIADDVFDPGYVVQMGRGTTVLTATHTYTGDTTVAAGKLIVDGSIAGSHTTVLNGGTLGGHGTLGDTTVRAGGTHAPGNSIGTQTVTGNYVLDAGAILEIEINGAGQSDKIVVSGTVDLTGAVIRILAAPGSYVPGTSYIFLENNGGSPIVGTFGQLVTNFAFLSPTLFASGNDLGVSLNRNSVAFVDVAQTPNQKSTAAPLDLLPDSDRLHMAVVGQTADGARAAFDALSGDVHATLGGLLVENTQYMRDALLARMQQAFHSGTAALGNGGPVTVAANTAGRMALGAGDGTSETYRAPAPRDGLSFWTQGYGTWGDFESDGNAAEAKRSLGGFVSGMDAAIGGSWRVGLATGYEQSSSSFVARRSSADVESYHLAAYAGGPWRGLALRSGAAWTWHDIDTSRAITFPGFLERADANYDGNTGQIFAEVALPFTSGRMALEPFAGLAYVHAQTDGFTETGSIGSLRSAGTDEGVAFSTLGVRAATTFSSNETDITPRVSVAWRHAYGDTTPGIALVFVSNGPGFGVDGLPLAEDSALVEAGFDLAIGRDATLGVSYTGQFAEDVRDHGVRGSLFWQF